MGVLTSALRTFGLADHRSPTTACREPLSMTTSSLVSAPSITRNYYNADCVSDAATHVHV